MSKSTFTCSLYILLSLTLHARQVPLEETSAYFNTSFLLNYDAVCSHLIKDGFRTINFPSEDNLTINGLWLSRDEPLCNILLCTGFYPGRKEGLAAFYHLLPEQCNILLFDARGHGASEGNFLSAIHRYGENEFLDIVGALRFIRSENNRPTIVFGMCAGAFHCIKAVHSLQDTDNHLMPAGLILDSSILSLHDAIDVPKKYFLHSILPNILRKYAYPNIPKKKIKQSFIYKIISLCAFPILSVLEYFFYPCTLLRNDQIDLKPLCNEIKIPIFFIHAQNDTFAPWHKIKECSSNAHKTWWPEQAEHACIYLQHKHMYQAHLDSFISDIITNI